MDTYTLMLAPPGVSLTKAVSRLSGLCQSSCACADIEEEIKVDPQTESALHKIRRPFTRPINMETITYHLPRTEVQDLWRVAVARSLSTLARSGSDVKILAGHMVYFSGKRNETYCVIRPDHLLHPAGAKTTLKPGRVVLLVDDVFDMYARLARRGSLYSSDKIKRFLVQICQQTGKDPAELPEQHFASITVGWELRNLMDLLSWRAMETVMAEHLARVLEADFVHWGVKQDVNSLLLALRGESRATVYLSHRITEARRQMRREGDWPAFCEEVNGVQDKMRDCGITLVSPTAIDELRFEQDDGARYVGCLGRRWPPCARESTLYEKADTAEDIDYQDLLPVRWRWDKEDGQMRLREKPIPMRDGLGLEVTDAMVNLLAREIARQVSARDFLILSHSQGVLVYRPYFPGKEVKRFSGGVTDELRLWQEIAALGLHKRAALVHVESDVSGMIGALGDERLKGSLLDAILDILGEEVGDVPRELVDAVFLQGRDPLDPAGGLTTGSFAERDLETIIRMAPGVAREARVALLKQYLVGDLSIEDVEDLCGIWVARDLPSLEGLWEDVASFLEKGGPRGDDWADRVDKFIAPLPCESTGP